MCLPGIGGRAIAVREYQKKAALATRISGHSVPSMPKSVGVITLFFGRGSNPSKGVTCSNILALTFILVSHAWLNILPQFYTPLEIVARSVNGFPAWLFLPIHPVQLSINNTEQWQKGVRANTATAWSLGSDQNRPECWTVIGTQLLFSNST